MKLAKISSKSKAIGFGFLSKLAHIKFLSHFVPNLQAMKLAKISSKSKGIGFGFLSKLAHIKF